jgi:hypothetical protein
MIGSLIIGGLSALNFGWTKWVNRFDLLEIWGLIALIIAGGTLGGLGMAIGFSIVWSIIVTIRRVLFRPKCAPLIQTPSELRIARAKAIFTTVKQLRSSVPSWKEIKTAWELA